MNKNTKIIITLIILILVALLAYFLLTPKDTVPRNDTAQNSNASTSQQVVAIDYKQFDALNQAGLKNGLYTNTKFGYQVNVGKILRIPMAINAYEGSALALQGKGGNLDMKELLDTVKNWKPENAELLFFTNITPAEETAFYDQVNSGQKLPYDFPESQLTMVVSYSTSTLDKITERTDPKDSLKKITIQNKFKGFIRETDTGNRLISLEFPSKGISAFGNPINRLTFFGKISKDNLLKIANSLKAL